MTTIAALLVLRAGRTWFVPAEVVAKLVPRQAVSAVPAAPFGVTLVAGRIVTVLTLGDAADHLVLCEIDGEPVALSGLQILQSGLFEARGNHIVVDGELVSELDVAAELRQVQESLWLRRMRDREA